MVKYANMPLPKTPLVSIIVPTLNEEHHITSCLQSIASQSYKNIEVIVVDQSSTDKTHAIALSMGATVISRPTPTFYSPPSASRNVGAQHAKGDVLYHLDADMVPHESLIQEAVNMFAANHHLVALAVHENDITDSFWTRCKAFERRCYWHNKNLQAARIVRTDIFKSVGGYDESIESGEDFYIDQQYKAKGQTAICNHTVAHDLTGLTFKRMLQKKYSYGKTGSSYFLKSGKKGGDVIMLQLTAYLGNYKRFLRHPVIGGGMIILRGLEILWGIRGMRAKS
jgi:glycosyltransferase involved in cell wall biosynthesis